MGGRTFHLKLKKDNSVFAKDHMMKESDGSLSPVDTSFIYSGHLEGEFLTIFPHFLLRHLTLVSICVWELTSMMS